jgi:hypothetical protein
MVLELGGGDFRSPGRLQSAEALGEFRRVGFAQVALGIALQVDDTELDVSLGEQALGDGQQAGEVVVDDQQHAPQPSFNQAAQDIFPLLQTLAPEPKENGQDALFAVAAEAQGQVEGSGAEPVAFFDLDVLGIKKEGEEIGIEGTRVAELELFQEVAGHGFQVLFGSGQTDSAQGSLGRIEGTTRGEQAEQQGLGFFRVITLVGGGRTVGRKLPLRVRGTSTWSGTEPRFKERA